MPDFPLGNLRWRPACIIRDAQLLHKRQPHAHLVTGEALITPHWCALTTEMPCLNSAVRAANQATFLKNVVLSQIGAVSVCNHKIVKNQLST